jgi:hypothetical protein
MKATIMKMTIAFIAIVFVATGALAQDKSNRPSPPATATGKIGAATITINYSSPAVKERKIWGELVPYNVAWRAGANEATTFETDKVLKVEGQDLPAGKYSLFAIPGENEWKVIFNSQTGQWGIKRTGEANRDAVNDVLTVTVKPVKSDMHERLAYEVNKNGIVLKWENVAVPVSIKQ